MKRIDLSPGKHELSERELDKLALQGMFDYPHNKVNNQLLENIDIKKADQKYYERFKSANRNKTWDDDFGPNSRKNSIHPTYRLNDVHKHHKSLSAIDEDNMEDNSRRNNYKNQFIDNPYQDLSANVDKNEDSDGHSQIQARANNYSRNNYQSLNNAQSDKNFSVIF